MNCNVRLIPSARKDFNKLDGREKLVIAKKMKRLSSNPFLGEKLGKRAGMDLIGYFVIVHRFCVQSSGLRTKKALKTQNPPYK